MNCARVLPAFGGHSQQPPASAAMPVDLAMYLSLSQRQPLYQLLSMSRLNPPQSYCLPRTGLQPPRPSSSTPVTPKPRSCIRRDSGSPNKKHVVFADAKGLALTAVRLFVPDSPSATIKLQGQQTTSNKLQGQQTTSNKLQGQQTTSNKLQGQQTTSSKLQGLKVRLGFPQPALDLKSFSTDVHIQLESCSVSEHSLSGKVCVSHVNTDPVVHVRVTFDSWQSHRDVPCTFLQQRCCFGGSDVDVFAFDFNVPNNVDPKERVEFSVCFRPGPGAAALWDDNKGQNYRVLVEKEGSSSPQGDAHRFYPTLSLRRPLSAQNCAADSANRQRNLSCRVRAQWRSPCRATTITM